MILQKWVSGVKDEDIDGAIGVGGGWVCDVDAVAAFGVSCNEQWFRMYRYCGWFPSYMLVEHHRKIKPWQVNV